MILPLPLVPFEEYMLLDDRPAYPMDFFFRLRFSGRFDRSTLDSAFDVATARHPLLAAMVRRGGRRFEWVPAGELSPKVCWATMPPGNTCPPAARIDLTRGSGLRATVLCAAGSEGRCGGGSTTDLLLQFHHSCCDGIGAFQFIQDLLVGYAVATQSEGRVTMPCPLEEQRLRERGKFGLTRWRLLRMAHRQAVGLLGASQFLFRRPVPVTPHEPEPADGPPPQAFPSAHTRRFDESDTTALRTVARAAGSTVNDLLARDLFLALGDWRTQRSVGSAADWLRLSVPMNLRRKGDENLPAANVVSMVFLDRRLSDFSDPGHLLDGIHGEMQQIKRLQLGLTFVLSLQVCRAVPGGLARMVRADRCDATCVFTNLGHVLTHAPLPRRGQRIVAGDVVLEDIEFLAPIRPYTCAAFAAFNYAGRLCVTLHYDPRPLTDADAEALLDGFLQRVRNSIETGDDTKL